MSKLLMIFVKNPVAGKVKTRLAATLGDQKALAIYQQLVQQTFAISKGCHCDKAIFYSDFIPDYPQTDGFIHQLQRGVDLGERMQNAFSDAFEQGYQSVAIIGSDCFELRGEIIGGAFTVLADYDVVLGPATDGGYYLLGMKKLHTGIFQNIDWSTEMVMTQTLSKCMTMGLTSFLLPVLSDIDEEKDLPAQFYHTLL